MKATDFRLNNYVKYNNRLFQIDTITFQFPTLNTQEYGIGVIDWNNIAPVEITEEILIDLGFKKLQEWSWKKDKFRVGRLRDKTWIIKIELFSFEIKYLHELQNLHYFLTQKELMLSESFNKP